MIRQRLSLPSLFAAIALSGCVPDNTTFRVGSVVEPSAPCVDINGEAIALHEPEQIEWDNVTLVVERGVDVSESQQEEILELVTQAQRTIEPSLVAPAYLRIKVCSSGRRVEVTRHEPIPLLMAPLTMHDADGRDAQSLTPRAQILHAYGQLVFELNGMRLSQKWTRLMQHGFRLAEVKLMIQAIEQQLPALHRPSDQDRAALMLAGLRGEQEHLEDLLKTAPEIRIAAPYGNVFADALAVFVLNDAHALRDELSESVFNESDRERFELRSFSDEHSIAELNGLPANAITPMTISAPTRNYLWEEFQESDAHDTSHILAALLEASFDRINRAIAQLSDEDEPTLPDPDAFNTALISQIKERL